jgi:phage portal protein BeeE
MCVLPAKSVSDALPAALANVIVLAESIEPEGNTSSKAQLKRLKLQQQQQAAHSKHNRKAARKARRAAAAEKVKGLSGLQVLEALEEEPSLLESDDHDDDDVNEHDCEGGSLLGTAADSHGSKQWQQQGISTCQTAWVDSEAVDAEAGAFLAGVEFCGDVDQDLMCLAQELCETFPADVEPLVDLTGGQAGAG